MDAADEEDVEHTEQHAREERDDQYVEPRQDLEQETGESVIHVRA